MKNMTIVQKTKCHAIIHSASAATAAVGAGLAQFPGSDTVVITPIQITMTILLGKVFGISLTESAAAASLTSVMSATVGRTASQVLVSWLPGAGNVINACTAVSITEMLGWLLVEDFAPAAA